MSQTIMNLLLAWGQWFSNFLFCYLAIAAVMTVKETVEIVHLDYLIHESKVILV